MALMIEAECNYDEKSSWMEFHGDRKSNRKTIEFYPISATEFMNHPKYNEFAMKHFVFLDEFSALPELALIKNLCRFVELTCVVASTNAKIANLIGYSDLSGSGSAFPSVWCAIIPHLPPINAEIIESSSCELAQSFKEIISLAANVSDNEAAKMKKLIDYIRKNQFKNCRPGVVMFIIEAIESIVNSTTELSLTVEAFLTELILKLKYRIEKRKVNVTLKSSGINANVKLIFRNSFDISYSREPNDQDASHLIDSHFYYLKNPYVQSEDPFILFHFESSPRPVYLVIKNKISTDEEMALQCYFKEEEELLLITCLLLTIKASTSYSLYSDLGKSSSLDMPNPQSIKRSGLEQENVALTALIDSSHYDSKNLQGSLTGVGFEEFLNNLLNNLNPYQNENRIARKKLTLTVPDEVKLYFEHLKVPFLFPADRPVFSIFDELFPCDGTGPLHFGTYHRAFDLEEIDAFFDILIDGKPRLAVMESKNHEDNLKIELFYEILLKSIKYEKKINIKSHTNDTTSPIPIPIHFTICQSISEFKKSKIYTSAIKNLADSNENQINILCIKPKEKDSREYGFDLIQAYKEFKIHSKPTMTAIIVELKVIEEMFRLKSSFETDKNRSKTKN